MRVHRFANSVVRPRKPRIESVLVICLSLWLGAACSQESTTPAESSAFGAPLSNSASLQEILRHPDIFQRAEAVGAFFQEAGPGDLDGIRRTFQQAPLDRGDLEYALFGAWWARFDPVGALLYALNDIRMEQPRVVNEVLRTWAYIDPESLKSASGFEDSTAKLYGFRGEMMDAIVVGWYESGQPGLADFILEQGDPEARQYGLKAWVRMKILHEGEEEALEWTQSLSYHADTKRLLLAAALATIAHQNPQLCIEWFHKAKEAGIDVNTLVPRITYAWGHHDPQAAIEWALTFPESSERLRAVQRVARKWRDQDATGMQEWVDEAFDADDRPDPKLIGLLQYQSLQGLVKEQDYRPDWEGLLRRANDMKHENRGRTVMLWLLQRWSYVDPDAAGAWIENNPYGLNETLIARASLLPEADKEQIDRVLGRLPADQL